MSVEIKVFSMENCSGCVTVKNMLQQNGQSYSEYDVMDVENMELAQSFGVRSVPTTVLSIAGTEHVFTGASKPVLDSIKLYIKGATV